MLKNPTTLKNKDIWAIVNNCGIRDILIIAKVNKEAIPFLLIK